MEKGRIWTVIVLWLAAGCLCAAAGLDASAEASAEDLCEQKPTIERWMVWDFWQALQPGMDKDRVAELLGEPLERETTETACVWYYQQAPQQSAVGIIQRPRFGLLNFKIASAAGREVMVLRTWKMPDWNEVRGYSAAQFEAEQKELRRLREEALRRQKELEEKQRLEEERRQQEELLRQQQLEQERQMRAQQAAAQRSSGFSWDNIPITYWYAAGGIVIGLIIAVILIKKPFMD